MESYILEENLTTATVLYTICYMLHGIYYKPYTYIYYYILYDIYYILCSIIPNYYQYLPLHPQVDSSFIYEATLCSRRGPTQNLNWSKCLAILIIAVPKQYIHITQLLHLRFREHCGREGRKVCRAVGTGML